MMTPEQILAAQKANVAKFFELGGKTADGVEKLAALNLQVARAALADSAELAQAVLAAKDPQALVALQSGLVQPAVDRAAAYSRSVYDIVSATVGEFTKAAETGAAESQKALSSLVEGALKGAPAGSENAVALVKSAVAAASNAYESVQKAAKQATNVVEANFEKLAANAVVKATPARTRKAA